MMTVDEDLVTLTCFGKLNILPSGNAEATVRRHVKRRGYLKYERFHIALFRTDPRQCDSSCVPRCERKGMVVKSNTHKLNFPCEAH